MAEVDHMVALLIKDSCPDVTVSLQTRQLLVHKRLNFVKNKVCRASAPSSVRICAASRCVGGIPAGMRCLEESRA